MLKGQFTPKSKRHCSAYTSTSQFFFLETYCGAFCLFLTPLLNATSIWRLVNLKETLLMESDNIAVIWPDYIVFVVQSLYSLSFLAKLAFVIHLCPTKLQYSKISQLQHSQPTGCRYEVELLSGTMQTKECQEPAELQSFRDLIASV